MARKLSRRAVANYVASRLIAGDDRTKLARLVAAYLIDTKRTHDITRLLSDIAAALADQGYVNGVVTVAHELSAEVRRDVERFAKQKTGAAHVMLSTKVDPSVLGGFRLSLPGRELDTTISHQLATLKTRYKKA